MNKQLINKYKPEFDHWLNDGSILVKYVNKNQAESGYKDWHEDNDVFESNLDYLIIINDQYSIYRKALAEGKTIQHNNSYLYSMKENWIDLKSCFFPAPVKTYRIKPDEPKFKVGDFVKFITISNKHPQQIIKIEDEIAYTEFNKCLLTQLILWTPVKGEWCWFYDNSDSRHSHLAQFYDIHKSSASSISTFMSSKGLAWNFCEPFLNSLPSYLKDK